MSVPSFGVVTHAVGHEPMPFAVCLEKCAAATAEHILLLANPAAPPVRPGVEATSHYPNILDSDPAELQRVMAAAGLRVGGLLPFVANDVSTDAAAEATRAAFAPWVEAANRIGCHTFCISAPRPPREEAIGKKREELLTRLGWLMDALVAGSPDPAFTVTVDIHLGALVETVDDARFLVGAAKEQRAGLLLNIGHLTTCRQDGWKLIEEHVDRIYTVGWKDHSLAEDRPNPVYSIELGTGESPFEKYIRAFKATDASHVTHFVNVEHPPLGDEVPTLQRSFAYIRNLWATTN
jgi:sugar phosphate isomerase/epimerase